MSSSDFWILVRKLSKLPQLPSLAAGTPYESRTHVTAVKEQCLDRLTNGAYKRHYRSSHACISFLSTLVPTQVGFVIPPNFYQAVNRLFSSFPFNISALTQQANCSAPIRFASGRGWTYDGSDPSLYNAPSSRAWLLAVRASSLAYSYTIVVANGFSIFTSPSSVEGSWFSREL